jgi:Peptidase family M23
MPNYVWPLSGTTSAPDMNTSFGPRINRNRWDFHDGIDLKSPIGTPVLAMRAGKVHRAGPAGTHGFSSRHVVLEVDDPYDGVMYLVHVHLSSIDPAIVQGASVTQGQVIGSVGDDDAQYAHLHFEFRKGQPLEKFSVHPLSYLPYTPTANFTAPIQDRFNRLNDLIAARLLFTSTTRAEGDLRRIEVDLFNGAATLGCRVVDFNDKTTINEGIGDHKLFVNDIGVEGYQKSNLIEDGRTDLHYGILVRNLPATCDRLVARVIDVGGHIATSGPVPVPDQPATNRHVDFEDGAMPPEGWRIILAPSGSTTSVESDATAAHSASRGMRCSAASAAGHARSACIEYDLPPGRFEWIAEGWFHLEGLTLPPGQSLRVLELQTFESAHVVAARIRNHDGDLRAGLVASRPDGSLISDDDTVSINGWHYWRLHICRIGTRETTGILVLDNFELARLNWDSSDTEPRRVRAGIARISGSAAAIVLVDDLRVTESTALV